MRAIWSDTWGMATYHHVESGERRTRNAARTYRHPIPWIRTIRSHIAFWGHVEVRP